MQEEWAIFVECSRLTYLADKNLYYQTLCFMSHFSEIHT